MKTENLSIVFLDIAGFTARTSTQTREENERMLRRFDDLVRPLVRAYDGRVVKTIGDAYLVTFRSSTNAILCAMGVHDRLAETDPGVDPAQRFAIRAAINTGDVRIEDGDVFGEAVNVASRIEGQAPAGEIHFSEAAYLAMTRSEVPAEEVGLVELRGIAGKVRIFRVPRAGEAGAYVLSRREGASSGADAQADATPLSPPVLPFGGLGLARIRERLASGGGMQFLEPVAARARGVLAQSPARLRQARGLVARGWDWWRVEVRRSRAVQIATAIAIVAVILLLAWALKPEPETRWQRFHRSLGF